MDIPERYVRLCLHVGRHVEDLVDAYFGPPEWQQSVAAAELLDPRELRDEALRLLADLDGADLEEDRCRWLRGQLRALDCLTSRLGGEVIAWADEVERTLGVRPTRTDTSVFEEVHRRLDVVLPGRGSVRERYVAWDLDNAVPRELLVPALDRLEQVLAPRAHELAPMPDNESVTYELVSDVPWIAYNWYAGDHHSHIEVSTDLPVSVLLLVDLAAHEAYPGHHTERSAKDAHLLTELGRVETSIVIQGPESVVSEGAAMSALEAALGPEPYHVVANVLTRLDLRFDPDVAHEVHRAEKDLYAVATNAAFMLHEDGASVSDAEQYCREWALESDAKAARSVGFVTDPGSRAYVSAYQDGQRLCREFVGRAPGNFTRLLTEQLTTVDLLS